MCDIAGSDKEMRKKWSQHKLENAFNDVAFADPVRGIFGATPIETLHCIRKGVIEYVTSFVIADDIKERELNLFNALASAFHKSHRQTYRKSFPTTDFSKGIVASKLSATERVGLIFLFVILFQYDEGWKMMQKRLGHTDKKSVPQLLEVLEGLLTFDAWVNQTVFWDSKKPDDKDARLMSIKKLMKMCKDRIKPLKKENPFRFPKFHEMLHLLDDMNRFGSPRNFCAQRPESLLIQAAKHPGRRAQKRHEGFELQAAQRLCQTYIIEKLHSRIFNESGIGLFESFDQNSHSNDQTEPDFITHGSGKATFGRIHRQILDGSGRIHVEWSTKTNINFMHISLELTQFILDLFPDKPFVNICTEYTRDIHTFRCHPNFQSDGPIYDWLNIDFVKYGICPCRLAAVVVLDNDVAEEDRYQLIVQCGLRKTGVRSTLLTEWIWSPKYECVSSNSIHSPVFVVSIKPDSSKILVTLPYDEWASKFT
jgi:hypothetical protein